MSRSAARPPRHLLAAVREASGYSLATYARAVAIQAAAIGYPGMAFRREKVARWEAGVEPEMPAQLAMASLHGVDPDQVRARGWPGWLLLALPGTDIRAPFTPEALLSTLDDLTSDPHRAAALLPADVLTDLTTRWTGHVQNTITRGMNGGYIGEEVSTALHARLTALWHLDDSLGGAPCTDSARTDLTMITRILRQARHTGQRTTDLHYLAAEYARFLGWAEFDAGRPAAAHRAWHTALRAAAEVADPAHSAYLLANLGLASIYDGQAHTAARMLATARDLAGTRTTPLVAAMVTTWEVRAAAATGDSRHAARLLARAETEYERSRTGDDNPAWSYWMVRPSHMAETGRAFLDLGDPTTAEQLLTDGLTALSPEAHRDRVLYQVWIATARVRRGRLDAAAHATIQALDTVRSVESGRCATLLTGLATELTPHRASRPIHAVLEHLEPAHP
ncbi:transcriptional regulator [Streptomyces sp. NPDC088789]|uniref:transcriptional regulator n=1 Tax=Streptomyces sp. NPDC088789 TaxID=3365899 RepID=UPI0038173C0F